MRIPFFGLSITINPEKTENDRETIYTGVVVKLPNGTEIGLAIVKTDEVGPELHYHESTVETYILLSGGLEIYRGDINSRKTLDSVGESEKIPEGTVHSARSSEGPAWFLVVSSPAWSEEDHYFYDGSPITH